MIQIERIVLNGLSTGGAFSGELAVDPGLVIVSGRNHYGKSLTATVIAWCFGVEPMFGISDNQPLCFPEAARDRLDLGDGVQHRVLTSRGGLFIKHSDGHRLELWRDIKGDTTFVDAKDVAISGAVKNVRLNTRLETMQDATGGLQYFLFEWMGWPREKVSTFRSDAWVYLENLAPLFYIDQAEGWTNIQALQISRYGQQKIAETAVEYLLGALKSVRQRFLLQQSEQRDQSLRDEAHSIADRVRSTLLRFGWDIEWSGAGTLAHVANRWKSTTLRATLLREADVDVDRSQKAVLDRAEKLRLSLTKGAREEGISASSEVSQNVINLKARRNELSNQLHTLRLQKENAESLAFTIQHKLKSAGDLLRYKRTHVGRLDVVECPTCHRDLDLNTFTLQQQTEESVQAHISALNRDRILMSENLKAMDRSISASTADLTIVDDELRTASSALRVITESDAPDREVLAKLAFDLSSVEREYERLQDVSREIDSLQQQISGWVESSERNEVLLEGDADLADRVRRFSTALQEYLKALGHMALMRPNPGKFSLDSQYVPYLDGRRLRSLGSASDQSRLVAAYTLGLAVTAENGGNHPGFVVLDEPLQQNPDPKHRDLFVNFLVEGIPSDSAIQVIVFTNLTALEVARLRKRGRNVLESRGEYFLQLIDVDSENAPTGQPDIVLS